MKWGKPIRRNLMTTYGTVPTKSEQQAKFLKQAPAAEQTEHILMTDGVQEVVTINVAAKDVLAPSRTFVEAFYVASESNPTKKYVVSRHVDGYWACGCRSWTTRRFCKHLKKLGLPGFLTPCHNVKILVVDLLPTSHMGKRGT